MSRGTAAKLDWLRAHAQLWQGADLPGVLPEDWRQQHPWLLELVDGLRAAGLASAGTERTKTARVVVGQLFTLREELRTRLADPLEAALRDIVAEVLAIDADDVTPDAKLVDDLKADEVDLIEIVVRCEEQFNFAVDEDEADALVTVGELLALVRKVIDARVPEARRR